MPVFLFICMQCSQSSIAQGHHTRGAVMKRHTDRGLNLIVPHHAKAACPACALAILEGDAPPGAQQATGRHPHCVGTTPCTVHKALGEVQATLMIWQNAVNLPKHSAQAVASCCWLLLLTCSNCVVMMVVSGKGKEERSDGNREGKSKWRRGTRREGRAGRGREGGGKVCCLICGTQQNCIFQSCCP